MIIKERWLGEQNFRFFVRELLAVTQPCDALGTSLIAPFLEFLWRGAELDGSHNELALIRDTLEAFRADSARR